MLKKRKPSQHRPVIVETGTHIPVINSIPRPRWNFKKASWKHFSVNLDKVVRFIPPVMKNYNRFVGALLSTAKKYIPRGYTKNYTPGWNKRCEDLYQQYLLDGNGEVADELLSSLDETRKNKWLMDLENMDFTHSSKKAWSVIKKLDGSSSCLQTNPNNINPNMIANHIVNMSRVSSTKAHTKSAKLSLKIIKRNMPQTSQYCVDFTVAEIENAIKFVKPGKAAGFDGVYPEFLLNSGPNVRKWLSKFYSDIVKTGNLPSSLKQTKIVAILKPGKLMKDQRITDLSLF